MKNFSKLMSFIGLAALIAACSQTSVPTEENFQALVGSSIIYVDKDAPSGGDGTTWGTAFDKLQDALDDARVAAPDEIWVAAGVYYPDEGASQVNNDPAASFYLVEGVAVYGGFDGTDGLGGGALETSVSDRDHGSNLTILDGDIEQNDIGIGPAYTVLGDNSDHIVTVDADGLGQTFTSATVLDGFIIRAGDSTGSGAGLLCDGDLINNHICSPHLENLWFHLNSASFGGAIAAFDSELSIEASLFTFNSATTNGGAIHNFGSSLSLGNSTNAYGDYNLVFSFNSAAHGGAISSIESDNSIDNATFGINSASNQGGAVYMDEGSLELTNSRLLRNEAEVSGGALYNVNGSPNLTSVKAFGNTAVLGGAIANTINGNGSGSSELINVAFSGNEASDDGGAIHNSNFIGQSFTLDIVNSTFNRNAAGPNAGNLGGSIFTDTGYTVNVDNSILWRSTDSTGFNEIMVNGGVVTIDHNIIRGGAAGITGLFINNGGNSPAAPQFTDWNGADGNLGTADDDLSLQATSPAIDAGDNSLVSASITTDIDGSPRIVGAAVDKGAYEVQ